MPPSDEVHLGPLTIALPDASTPELVLDADLTALLGVETNGEAEAKLRAALGRGRRGVESDSEAGSVLVHASGVDAMLRVLAAIDAIAPGRPLWTAAELEAAASAMRAWRRPKRVKYDAGALVAVPIEGGGFGAMHVGGFEDGGSRRGWPLAIALDVEAATLGAIAMALAAGVGRPVGARVIDDAPIKSGEWPLAGSRPVDEALARSLLERERGSSSSAGILAVFLGAWLGRLPWDVWGSPLDHDRMALEGVPPHAARRRLRDLVEARLREADASTTTPRAHDPALLDVRIAYRGSGPPALIDLPKQRRLTELLAARVPGAGVVLKGAGEGFLDVFVETDDAGAGVEAAERAAAEIGIAKDTLVEARARVPLAGLVPW
jgi:hypothetical protein